MSATPLPIIHSSKYNPIESFFMQGMSLWGFRIPITKDDIPNEQKRSNKKTAKQTQPGVTSDKGKDKYQSVKQTHKQSEQGAEKNNSTFFFLHVVKTRKKLRGK